MTPPRNPRKIQSKPSVEPDSSGSGSFFKQKSPDKPTNLAKSSAPPLTVLPVRDLHRMIPLALEVIRRRLERCDLCAVKSLFELIEYLKQRNFLCFDPLHQTLPPNVNFAALRVLDCMVEKSRLLGQPLPNNLEPLLDILFPPADGEQEQE